MLGQAGLSRVFGISNHPKTVRMPFETGIVTDADFVGSTAELAVRVNGMGLCPTGTLAGAGANAATPDGVTSARLTQALEGQETPGADTVHVTPKLPGSF